MFTKITFRFFDIVLSFFLLLVLSGLILSVGVVIYLFDGAPPLFVQKRVGLNCQIFNMFKFRTMQHNPQTKSGELISGKTLEEARNAYQTTQLNDPRITKIGKFLRKSHLDELPQFLNVLKGDMSLVGPRPDAPVQEFDYRTEDWKLRHTMKPGITGVSQVSLNKKFTRTEADLYWVSQNSVLLYFKVLRATFFKIFRMNSF